MDAVMDAFGTCGAARVSTSRHTPPQTGRQGLTRRAALGLGLAALIPGATRPAFADMVVEDARGQARVPERPRTTLVFDIAALDTLDALGVAVAGVPGSNLPDYLGRYRDRRYLKIGTLFEPDYEAVNAAAPDLIIVGPRSAAKYADLAKLAPTLDLTVPADRFVAGTRAHVALLGRIFDRQPQADALLARMDAAIARVKGLAPKAGRVLMVMVNGGKLTAFGAGSRYGWIYDDLGFTPAAASDTTTAHGEVISFEYILKTDPDWLFVLDRDAAVGRGGAAARAVLDNELVAATRAAKAGRVLDLDAVRWYIVGSGGAALATITEELAQALDARSGK
ncbi:siderophore ABC transporter substrate-binding protein [Xanthobacter autotrophicus]|uniref:siderophore ABC transporter substrate-binding protein n=1 Tax=Xanthobacter autotrophicus TaxID=280 RepID=UPI003729129A